MEGRELFPSVLSPFNRDFILGFPEGLVYAQSLRFDPTAWYIQGDRLARSPVLDGARIRFRVVIIDGGMATL